MKTLILHISYLLRILCFSLPVTIQLQAQENHLWQEKQAYNWTFGKFAGISFVTGDPIPINGVASDALEGSATISSANGELALYASANTIYNKDHQVMSNGDALTGWNSSSTQAGVIIPKPGNPNIYYAIGIPDIGGTSPGLTYSVVDMTLSGGNGAVTADKNIVLYEEPTAEKITAVHHANGVDVWVIVHALGSNEFLSFLVTENGISTTPVISEAGLVYPAESGPNYDYGAGQLKASPDGSRLATVIPGVFLGMDRGVEVYDFDNITGTVSNAFFIESITGIMYTLEFSPNGEMLYVVDAVFAWLLFINSQVRQYDLTAGDNEAIEASMQVVADLTGTQFVLSNMQLAPDGRIYIANISSTSTLHVIKNPNNEGFSAGFEAATVSIGDGTNMLGLPTFIQSYFESGILYEGYCTNQPVTFSTLRIPDITSITWNFGDPDSGEANISSDPSHVFSNPGTYTVTAEITSNGSVQIATVQVEIIQGPEANIPDEELRTQCADSEGNALFDLTSLESVILDSQDPDDFTVTFYASEEDYIADNEIETPAEFVTGGQTVYVTVSGGETDCVSQIIFDLIVNPLPVLTPLEDIEVCGNLQGIGIFNLSQYNSQLLAGQNQEEFQINYYTDADNTIMINQPESFESVTGAVYANVANLSTGCTAVMPINLIVGPVGNIEMSALLGCSPFDLTLIAQQLQPDYVLSFYENEDEALADNQIENPVAYNAEGNSGTVYVVAQDSDGCYHAGILVLESEGCVVPKGISPNNDGLNDNFDLSSFNVNELVIFNRYGIEVFGYSTYTNEWHGQDGNGNELPTGTYYYVISLASGENMTGWVYINRDVN